MDIFEKSGDDVSKEMRLSLGIMMYCTYAAEILAYRMAETMDSYKLKNTLVQDKKQHFNKARRMLQDMIRSLEIAFDDTYGEIADKQSGSQMHF